MALRNENGVHRKLQIIALNTPILNFSAETTSYFLLAVKLVHCDNTIRLSLFQAMKHFE